MAKRVTFLLILAILLQTSGWVQAQTQTFSEVVVRGHQRIDASAIRALIKSAPGEELSLEQIDEDIRAIFQMGRFRDVRALREEHNGAQILVFEVSERPLVREVLFSGNRKLKEDKLRPLLTLKVPDIYDVRAVEASREAIRGAYRTEGYHAAQITAETEISAAGEASITFHIDEGPKVLVGSIRFGGNQVLSDRQLRKAMETRKKWFLSWLTKRGTFNEEILEIDVERIVEEYFNRGYVDVVVKKPVVTLDERGKTFDIFIEIEEGEQYRIGELDVSGDLLTDKPQLLSLVSLAPSDVFSRALLRKSLSDLTEYYADRGYAYANVTPLTQVEPAARLINITFEIEQGHQVRIERITVSGNTKSLDKVIRRELRLLEGELYSSSGLRESRRHVNNTGFFEEVNISTSQGSAPELMNVDVDVKERATGSFSIGAGYSSVDGVIGQASLEQANFLGRGLNLRLSGARASRSTTYTLGITDPYFLDKNLTVGADIYRTEREWPSFSERRSGLGLKAGFPVMQDVRAFFLYRYEQKYVYDVEPTASLIIREQEGNSTLSSITASLMRDTTDYRLDPTRGSMSEASVEFAGLGGTEKFVKYVADHRHFFPFKWDTYFSVHGQIGYVHSFGGNRVPIGERFFLGGINSLRGFRSRRVGPRDGDEFIGGHKHSFAQFEYIFPLLKESNLKGVAFFDIGNAWGENEDYFSDLRYNTGAGIRWNSPLGPLRLEWGYNLDPRDDESRTEWQFSLGRFF